MEIFSEIWMLSETPRYFPVGMHVARADELLARRREKKALRIFTYLRPQLDMLHLKYVTCFFRYVECMLICLGGYKDLKM